MTNSSALEITQIFQIIQGHTPHYSVRGSFTNESVKLNRYGINVHYLHVILPRTCRFLWRCGNHYGFSLCKSWQGSNGYFYFTAWLLVAHVSFLTYNVISDVTKQNIQDQQVIIWPLCELFVFEVARTEGSIF